MLVLILLKEKNLSQNQASKQPRHSSSTPRILPQQTVEQDVDIEEIVPVVKSEPISENTATVMSNSPNLVEQQQSMAMYEDRSQLVGLEHYDEHYVGEYEGQYDQGYDSSMMVPQDTGGPGPEQCPICFKFMLRNNIQKHIRAKHSEQENAECPECAKTFKTSYYMKEHLRKYHGIGQ